MRLRPAFCIVLPILAGIFPSAPPAGAQTPEIEVFLEYRPSAFREEGQPTFELAYAVRTPHSEAEFSAFFPEIAFSGAVRGRCGMRSTEGLRLTMDRSVRWTAAFLVPPSPLAGLQPAVMQLLLVGQVAFAVEATVTYRDLLFDAVGADDAFDDQLMVTPRAHLELSLADAEVPWTATVGVECYCEYRDATQNVRVGVLTSSDIGGEPLHVTRSGRGAPIMVTVEGESWGAWKAHYPSTGREP